MSPLGALSEIEEVVAHGRLRLKIIKDFSRAAFYPIAKFLGRFSKAGRPNFWGVFLSRGDLISRSFLLAGAT